jgi:hypothetical protein
MSLQYETETKTESTGDLPSATTVVYQPGKVVQTIEECAGEVRWNGRRLEQAWLLRDIGTTGAIEAVRTEWRAVPTGEWP